jgi:REP element-mobilizing transposase RayT
MERRFFNPYELILRHGDRLPHWEQSGSTYFLTFRLADSIPQSELKRWKEERDEWLSKHPEPWSDDVETAYHRIFSARVDRHLDAGMGTCLLRNRSVAEAFAETLLPHHEIRFLLHSFVVMPNHVHMLVTLNPTDTLPEMVKIWKGASARKIGKITSTRGKLWQRDYFDRLIRDEDHFFRVARYIRANPAKARLSEEEYLLWESEEVIRLLAT